MRPSDGTNNIESVGHVGDPVAYGLVQSILQRTGTGADRDDFRAQQLHAENVWLLPLHIDLAHVDRAGQAEQRRDGGRGNAVLPRASFGDDTGLAHALGQQDLTQAIIDLVTARMVQLIALEIDLGAADMLGQTLGKIKRARPTGILRQVIIQFLAKAGVSLGGAIGVLQFQDQGH